MQGSPAAPRRLQVVKARKIRRPIPGSQKTGVGKSGVNAERRKGGVHADRCRRWCVREHSNQVRHFPQPISNASGDCEAGATAQSRCQAPSPKSPWTSVLEGRHLVPLRNCTASLLVDASVLPSIGSMVLQLILNVIIISGVTSLALMWFLQKRAHLKSELNVRREPDQHDEKTPLTQTASTLDHSEEVLKEPLCEPGGARLVPPPLINGDIRQYVAHRVRSWAALSVAGERGANLSTGYDFYRHRDKHAGLRRQATAGSSLRLCGLRALARGLQG